MGHGLTDGDQGNLVFATKEGRARTIAGSDLSQIVQGSPALGLALLNACHSAAVPKASGADPLAGVAGALVRGGLPAVIGMQFAISDRAALLFSKILYERLAVGDPIEAAVSDARLAIYLADPSASDWVAPVLFLRGSDRRMEEEAMKGKQVESDDTQVDFEADVLESAEADITGRILSDQPAFAEGRPEKTHTRVKLGEAKLGKLTIVGSNYRGSK